MTTAEAEAYHFAQVGDARRGRRRLDQRPHTHLSRRGDRDRPGGCEARAPVVISFTVETDGRLPGGTSLGDAIERVDAETEGAAGVLHDQLRAPDPFRGRARGGAAWVGRVGGIRANASKMSHAELDESEVLDEGDPVELGEDYRALRPRLPAVNVVGGCCGTDHRHIAAIADAWLAG